MEDTTTPTETDDSVVCENCECQEESTLADVSQIKTETSSGTSQNARSISWFTNSYSKERQIQRSLLKSGALDVKITPFYLRWSYGLNVDVAAINLTTKTRSFIFFATGLAAAMYDYVSKEMRLLHGHSNFITSISCNNTGHWLVTADGGNDNAIIVWEGMQHKAIHTIFNPFPENGTAVVGISGSGKYLVAVSLSDIPIVKFWLWTYGEDNPDNTFTGKSTYGKAIKISFNPNIEEHIMIAFEYQIIFLYWDSKNKKLEAANEPKIRHKKIGIITDCTYVNTCHQCVASTTSGCVLIYGCTLYVREYVEAALDNHKIYVKLIKISKVSINCITSADGIIVTGDDNGFINFYDKRMKLMYWSHEYNLSPIHSISFNLEQKNYRIMDAEDEDFDDDLIPSPRTLLNDYRIDYEDKVEEYETIYMQNLPSDATLQKIFFLVRDFIILTKDGIIYFMDYVNKILKPITVKADSTVTAIDTHEEKDYLCIAYENGRICLFNYISHQLIAENTLPVTIDEETETPVNVSCIKYSPQALHLACGRSNGEIWFLEPILLTKKYKKPSYSTRNSIEKIAFSYNSKYMAYFDENNTTCLLKYIPEINKWHFMGKVRAHYKKVNDITFSPYEDTRLFTISDDRFIVEYDLLNSSPAELQIQTRERIEQSAIPKCFTCYPSQPGSKEHYLLIMDDQYKYKLVNDVTFMCRSVILGPSYGCYRDYPVRKIGICKNDSETCVVFSTDKHIGIQKIPLDCSPYKYIGIVGHPSKITDTCCSRDGKYIFSIGENDRSVLMWQINTRSLEVMERLGGTELDPYYCLMEGGINGWLFGEMQDLFYYMQILHQGENTMLPRVVSDYIPITELPDLMRACGFYPSEFEVENMIVDIKYRNFDRTGELNDQISFLEFVKLYLNHRPAHGVEFEKLEENFDTFMYSVDEPELGFITKEALVESLCIKGEPFNITNLRKCFSILMHHDEYEDENSFSFLPGEITFDTFIEDILGIDMEKQTVEVQKVTSSIVEEM